jgi:hypothetical protein
MPLFLKSIAPELDIFGNRQSLNFNKNPAGCESASALTLINWFNPIPGVDATSAFDFLNPALKGFRFNHSVSTTGIFGDFAFEKYDRFGTTTPLWGYNEATDTIKFFKPIDANIGSGNPNIDLSLYATVASVTSLQSYVNSKTWLASQISDFDAQVRLTRLDQLASPIASLSMGGQILSDVATPINGNDAATRIFVQNYVDDNKLHYPIEAAAGNPTLLLTASTLYLNGWGSWLDPLQRTTATSYLAKIIGSNSVLDQDHGYAVRRFNVDQVQLGFKGSSVADSVAYLQSSGANGLKFNTINPSSSSYLTRMWIKTDGTIDFNGTKLINLVSPTTPNEPATKNYVDTQITSAGLGGGITYPADDTLYLNGDGAFTDPLQRSVLADGQEYLSTLSRLWDGDFSAISDTGFRMGVSYSNDPSQYISQLTIGVGTLQKFYPNNNIPFPYIELDGNFGLNFIATDGTGLMAINGSGIVLNNFKLQMVGEPELPDDGATKNYVDDRTNWFNVVDSGTVDLNYRKLSSLANGVYSSDACTFGQMTTEINFINAAFDEIDNKINWFDKLTILGYDVVKVGKPLLVRGFFVSDNVSYAYLNNSGNTGTSSGSNAYSIFCEARILASEFNAFSSIKKKTILSENEANVASEAITLLKQIPTVKYQYKDKIKEGAAVVYGVIAESLNKILPDYVDMNTQDFVPNIMTTCKVEDKGGNTYRINIKSLDTEIDPNTQKVRLITIEKAIDVEILKITDDYLEISTEVKLGKEEFIYGTYETCPSVSKPKLFELSMVVVQNLLKRVEHLEQQLNNR